MTWYCLVLKINSSLIALTEEKESATKYRFDDKKVFVYPIGLFWLWCANMSLIKTDPREIISCGIFYSILVGSTTLSNLYLASMSIDRSMMILYPARYRLIVTRSRVILRLTLITLIITVLLIPHHFYFYYKPGTTLFLCDLHSSVNYRRIRLWSLIHAILFVSVPSLIVCICSSILLHNRCKHKRLNKNNLSVTARRMHRRSILLFFVSLWLLLSLLPICILQIFIIHKRLVYPDSYCSMQWKIYRILLNCFLTISTINYSNKFYIHLIVSTTARKHFIQFITCTSDQQLPVSIRMNDRNNNKQCLLSAIDQTKTNL